MTEYMKLERNIFVKYGQTTYHQVTAKSIIGVGRGGGGGGGGGGAGGPGPQ